MTAVGRRRRRGTFVAIAVVLASLGVASGLTVAGVRTLLESRAGRRAEGLTERVPTQRLPFTPTALVGTVDDEGRLTSVAVLAIERDGTGGSIVQLAASADADSGNSGVLRPLHALYAVEGAESFAAGVESLTGLSFDVVEIIDADRFALLVSPLGDLPVELPVTFYDASSGEVWGDGNDVLGPTVAARALTAVDPAVEDWRFEPARGAIWRAVADRVGAGIGSARPVASDHDIPQMTTLDEVIARLFAAPVAYRALAVRPIAVERVDEQLPENLAEAFGPGSATAVAVHDRAETLMVMGAVAPARVGAPLDAPSFRVVSGYTSAQLDAIGVRGSDVLKQAIDRLLFAQTNVVSVAELDGITVPEHTAFVVADPSTLDGVRERYAEAFGDKIEIRAADTIIEGVDIELVLGRDFLDRVVVPEPIGVAGSD